MKSEIHIKQPKLEIPAKENKVENEKHFNDRLKDVKVILTLFAAGQEVGTIARHFRIAESYVKDVTECGIEKFEQKLRKWYEVPLQGKIMTTETPKVTETEETVQSVEAPVEPVVETTPAVNETVEPGVQQTGSRIKGGVKLAEEKIVEMVTARMPEGIPMKDLKAAAPEGINPNTWVIRISKLKIAGKITVADGVVKAV